MLVQRGGITQDVSPQDVKEYLAAGYRLVKEPEPTPALIPAEIPKPKEPEKASKKKG